jgi:hypothetical protein
MSGPALSTTAAVVDPTTLDRKLMFGYQGWFACPSDGSPIAAWEHWFVRGQPARAATLRVDMWPDVSELSAEERCETPLTLPSGATAQLYSAYNPKTVDRHFRWMQEYGLAGVFLQRFTVRLGNPAILGFRDGVARNVQSAAESNGRVFAIMYDISGHPRETVVDDVKRDWVHLVDTLHVTSSPQYLHHRGRPLLAIWGLGFVDRSPTPEQAAELIDFFKNHPDPRYRVTLLGGVPARWRTLSRDSKTDPRWAAVYRSFDILSPWSVGRFRDDSGIDRFYAEEVREDMVEARRLRIDYLPVVFPGFSWHNMNPTAPFNRIPRRGGRFYWRQVGRALQAGTTMLYGAMFDEVDEGTAMFKVAASRRAAPADVPLVTLDQDGEQLPTDWYLRLAREAQKALIRQSPGRDRQRVAETPATRPAYPSISYSGVHDDSTYGQSGARSDIDRFGGVRAGSSGSANSSTRTRRARRTRSFGRLAGNRR